MASNFYNTLFGIEIALFGIVIASTLVVFQILYSNYSHRDAYLAFKLKSLWIYLITSICLIVVTGLGALHFAMGTHNLIPRYNLYTKEIFQNEVTLFIVFFSLLITVVIGIFVLNNNLKLVNPYFLLNLWLKKVNNKTVSNFLYNKYGVPETSLPIKIIFQSFRENDNSENEELEYGITEKEYAEKKKRNLELKKASISAEDIFVGIENILLKSISQGERRLVIRATDLYSLKVKEILNEADDDFPYNHLATYVSESLNVFLETARKNNNLTLTTELIRFSGHIITYLVEKGKTTEIKQLLQVWKQHADTAIENNEKIVFKEIINNYKEIGDLFFIESTSQHHLKEVSEYAFINLGWLAERLILKKGIRF